MKKVIYAILICIIIAGTIITATMGFKANLVYSKNVQIDIYVGKTVNVKEIKEIVNQVFPNENAIIKKVELFNDMVAVILPEKTDEELKEKVKELNTKINEKYDIKNKAEDLTITHNSKIRLSSIIKPYIIPMAISIAIILVFVCIRYHKLKIWNVLLEYILSVGAIEAIYLSVLSIAKIPVNRLIIPIGLLLYIVTITIITFINESNLAAISQEEEEK